MSEQDKCPKCGAPMFGYDYTVGRERYHVPGRDTLCLTRQRDHWKDRASQAGADRDTYRKRAVEAEAKLVYRDKHIAVLNECIKELEAKLNAFVADHNAIYELGPGPTEQAKCIPLPQWIATRFVHVEHHNGVLTDLKNQLANRDRHITFLADYIMAKPIKHDNRAKLENDLKKAEAELANGIETLVKQVAEQDEQLKQLQQFARYTHDGVLIVPGMTVWGWASRWRHNKPLAGCVIGIYVDDDESLGFVRVHVDETQDRDDWYPSSCYSTLDAANAAVAKVTKPEGK